MRHRNIKDRNYWPYNRDKEEESDEIVIEGIDEYQDLYFADGDVTNISVFDAYITDALNKTTTKFPDLSTIKPTHYRQGTIEPIDFIDANQLDFYEGNIVKYVTRWKHKNGLEDLNKALWYLKRLVNNVERQREETASDQEQA